MSCYECKYGSHFCERLVEGPGMEHPLLRFVDKETTINTKTLKKNKKCFSISFLYSEIAERNFISFCKKNNIKVRRNGFSTIRNIGKKVYFNIYNISTTSQIINFFDIFSNWTTSTFDGKLILKNVRIYSYI